MGKPFVSLAVIVSLIGATTIALELQVNRCVVDSEEYPKGIEATEEDLSKVNLLKDKIYGEWNYTISPNGQPFPFVNAS